MGWKEQRYERSNRAGGRIVLDITEVQVWRIGNLTNQRSNNISGSYLRFRKLLHSTIKACPKENPTTSTKPKTKPILNEITLLHVEYCQVEGVQKALWTSQRFALIKHKNHVQVDQPIIQWNAQIRMNFLPKKITENRGFITYTKNKKI